MGKKAKSPSAKKAEVTLDAQVCISARMHACTRRTHRAHKILLALQVVEQVTAIKNEANKLFAKKEYLKAIEQYDAAGKLLPEGAGERADLLCNKAACYYQMKRCVSRSCTAIVNHQPHAVLPARMC